eukprot:402717_1
MSSIPLRIIDPPHQHEGVVEEERNMLMNMSYIPPRIIDPPHQHEGFVELECNMLMNMIEIINSLMIEKCKSLSLHKLPGTFTFNFVFNEMDAYLSKIENYDEKSNEENVEEWWNNHRATEMALDFLPTILDRINDASTYIATQETSNSLQHIFEQYLKFYLLQTVIQATFNPSSHESYYIFPDDSFKDEESKLRQKLENEYFTPDEITTNMDKFSKSNKNHWVKLIKIKANQYMQHYYNNISPLTDQKLQELKLKSSTIHTQLRFNYCCVYFWDRFILVLGWIFCCPFMLGFCPCIWCDFIQHIQSQKVIVTPTQLIYARDELACFTCEWKKCLCNCCRCSRNNEYKENRIQMSWIKEVEHERCIRSCSGSISVNYNNEISRGPYAFYRMRLIGLHNPNETVQFLNELVDLTRMNIDKKHFSCSEQCLDLWVALGFAGAVLVLFGFFSIIVVIVALNYEITIINMDGLFCIFSFLNSTILLVILIQQYLKIPIVNQQISRSVIQFEFTMSKSLRIQNIIIFLMIIIYSLNRGVFRVLRIGICKIYLTLNVLLGIFTIYLFVIRRTFLNAKILSGCGACINVLVPYILFLLPCGEIILIYFDGNALQYCSDIYAVMDWGVILFYNGFILLTMCLYYGTQLVLCFTQTKKKVTTSIRKSDKKIANIKLYNIMYGLKTYTIFTIIDVCIIIMSLGSWCFFEWTQWSLSIGFFFMSWSIFLSHPQNSLLFSKLCARCIWTKELVNEVQFDALFSNPKDEAIHHKQSNTNNEEYELKEMHLSIVSTMKPIDEETMKEMVDILEGYNSIMNSTDDIDVQRPKVVKYCHDTHLLLDKYIDIISKYEFEEIYSQCKATNCHCLSRHNRDRRRDRRRDEYESKYDDDAEFVFYRDLLDGMHSYLFHRHELGMRIESFKNKFNISVNNDETETDTTLKDELFEFLLKSTQESSVASVQTMKAWMQDEEYDSDAINGDIADSMKQSNIFNTLNEKNVYQQLSQYCKSIQIYSSSFQVGFRFYYWPYYEKNESNDEDILFWNKNDHGGYTKKELYVEKKYQTLKEEILNHPKVGLLPTQYELSVVKASKYMNTERVKSIKVNQTITQEDPLKYNIRNGTSITEKHILSIIIYCDWTNLSTEFTKTFRKELPYQSIESIIENNKEFANWSRLIRETVEYYGCKGFGETYGYEYRTYYQCNVRNLLYGPFYCGMSFVAVMPEFNIRLCGPTSTSRQIEVAENFGGKGIIIQLNNNGSEISGDLRGFTCRWISTYAGEDEVLFVGGEYQIKIENISIMKTQETFSEFFEIFYCFDCMVSGTIVGPYYVRNIKKNYYKVLNKLIKGKISPVSEKTDYHEYITKTFEAYTNHKTEIILNLHEIHTHFLSIRSLILHPLLQTKIVNPTKPKKK